MNNEFVNQLSKLKIEQNALKRNIDINYFNKTLRAELFKRLKEVEEEIEKVKFKIKMEKDNKNENISD